MKIAMLQFLLSIFISVENEWPVGYCLILFVSFTLQFATSVPASKAQLAPPTENICGKA